MSLLEFFCSDLVALLLVILFVLGTVAVVVWGIVAAVKLIVAWFAGHPLRIRPRRLLVAGAIVLVPLCLFLLVTWRPQFSERVLRGLSDAEVVERAGRPDIDTRQQEENSAVPGDFQFRYFNRGFRNYWVTFHEGRVVRVQSCFSDK